MTSYFALLLLLVALAGFVLLAWRRDLARTRALPVCAGLGMAAAMLMALGRLPAASVNLPLGPLPEMGAWPGLLVAFAPDNAVFVLLAMLCAACAGMVATPRGGGVAGLAALATAALLVADRLHLAGLLALLVAALWWTGRRRARVSGGWRGVIWPVAGVSAALGLCVAAGSPLGSVLRAASAALLSAALARAGSRDAWLAPGAGAAPRAGAWAGGFGTIAGLALLWRTMEWTVSVPDPTAGLSYASPGAVALRQAGGVAGVTMLLAGVAIAGFGAWRGLRARGLRAALTEAGFVQLGLAWVAAGLGAQAEGASLPVLAATARGAAWLMVLVAALSRIGGLCVLEAVSTRAGHDGLDRLGGLARLMPVQSLLLGGVLAQFAPLPPLAGFAAGWALLQALLAAPAGFDLPGRCFLLAVTIGVAAALAGLAGIGLRVTALALLGRPRTPRVAGAEDPAGFAAWVASVPLGLAALCGLLPGWALLLAAGVPLPPGAWALGGASGAVYAPLVLAVVLGLVSVGLWLVWRGRVGAAVAVARWEDGAAPPPAWLPFGDPDQQPGLAFLRPVRIRTMSGRTYPLRRRVLRRADAIVARLGGDEAAESWLPGALLALVCVLLIGAAL